MGYLVAGLWDCEDIPRDRGGLGGEASEGSGGGMFQLTSRTLKHCSPVNIIPVCAQSSDTQRTERRGAKTPEYGSDYVIWFNRTDEASCFNLGEPTKIIASWLELLTSNKN